MMSRKWADAMDANGFRMGELGALALFLGGSDDSFTGDILHLIAKSDPANRVALSYAFPRELAAWQLWQHLSDHDGGPPTFAQFYDEFHMPDPEATAAVARAAAVGAVAAAPVRDGTHPAIELRITTPAGVIVQCDSDFAHFSTLFRGVKLGQWITLVRHLEGGLFDGGELGDIATALTIEIRAIELADNRAPDDASELLGQVFPPAG